VNNPRRRESTEVSLAMILPKNPKFEKCCNLIAFTILVLYFLLWRAQYLTTQASHFFQKRYYDTLLQLAIEHQVLVTNSLG